MLQKITWKDEYKVQVGIIDEHHKKFVEILGNLYQVLASESCEISVSEIFFSLAHYAEHHLLQEEIYFKNYKYSGFQNHKEAHMDFIERITTFQKDFAVNKPDVCRDLYVYLLEWFQNHILAYDRDAVSFLVEKGLDR